MTSTINRMLFGATTAVMFGTTSMAAFALGAPDPIESERWASRIVNEANQYRRSKGVAPVVPSESLRRAAQRYADYLARNMKSGHGADGKTAKQRVAAVGYKVCAWGESLYEPLPIEGIPDPRSIGERVVSYWKPYPGSNRHLLNSRVKQVGVGVASWSHDSHYHFFKVVYLSAGSCD